MKTFRSQAIILARTNYGESARIITFLTPDHGKIKAIAKGVRKQKSKLAGGIELFSVSDISFIQGRGEIDTVVSTKMLKHYGDIVKDLSRTNLGYELIKKLNKATEDAPENAYFDLLDQGFMALDDPKIDLGLIELWFNMQLLRLAGHTPDLRTDTAGKKLAVDQSYDFDFEKMCFAQDEQGGFTADHIKFLRLGFSANPIQVLNRVKDAQSLSKILGPLVQAWLQAHVRT